MVKNNTTISIDSEVKEKVKAILEEKRYNLSMWVEEMGKKLIENYNKEAKNNGTI